MLSYALAIAIVISSLVLFSTAFLMSDLHRKDDFLWSGVGLFYALILWYCAKNITGAVLLGQAAATALLISYGWQTLKLRKAIANPEQIDEINNFSLLQSVGGLLKRKKPQIQATDPVTAPINPKVTEEEIAIPETTSQKPPSEEVSPKIDTPTASANISVNNTETIENIQETVGSTVDSVDLVDSDSKLASEEVTESTESTDHEPENKPDLPNESEIIPEKATTISEEDQSQPVVDSSIESQELKPTSSLDSLETVEVAEVLEALPDEASANRESDQSNIIEVATTEINTSSEATEIVQNPEEKAKTEETS